MLQLVNKTPFAATLFVIPNREGIDTLYVVVRATFDLLPSVKPAEVQPPPVLADEYWGEPGASSLKYASELHIGKPGTDVVVVGSACAPGDHPVAEVIVGVTVAERRQVAVVRGDRTWKRGGGITSPIPFKRLPLVWENAYGGTHRYGTGAKDIVAEEQNPVGRGFVGKRSADDVVGEKLPNIEDPSAPLESPGKRSRSIGFGFVAPSWLPRRRFAGTYDTKWQRERAPFLPVDFDSKFLMAAPYPFVFDRHLEGGEIITMTGMHPEGPLRIELPRWQPNISIEFNGSTEAPACKLETIILEPDQNCVTLYYRADLVVGAKILRVEQVEVVT